MSMDLYPQIAHDADLSPTCGREIDEKCEEVHEACKGWGTNEGRLIKALGSTTAEQRYKIAFRYEEMYGKDLKALMKKECSGDFGGALQLLALGPAEAEAQMIKDACSGVGTKEKHLYPIVCGRSNTDMETLKKAYYKMYNKDLGQLLASELGGNFEKLVFCALQGIETEFDPEFHTKEKAQEDAEAIYKAGQGKMGTDEKRMFNILCSSPPKHLAAIDAIYADKYGFTLLKAFEKELGGDAEKASLFVVGMKLKPYETVANLIKDACAGIGTDETLLTNCIIRYQPIMHQVNVAHIELFSKSVEVRVKKETRGDYEKLLVQLLRT